jgi:DNA-binding NarL/FixJ family response regulator
VPLQLHDKAGLAARILTIEDHAIVRQGIRHILASKFPALALGEVATPQEALAAVCNQHWNLILLDISILGWNGIELLKEIKAIRPKLPVLILTMYAGRQFTVRALKAGADGCLALDGAVETLLEAVGRLLAGGKFISPTLAEDLAFDVASDARRPPHESLSDREFEVLQMIGSGRTVGEIAEQLHLSVKTISTYRTRILEKMQMRNNAELMRYAIQSSLTEQDRRFPPQNLLRGASGEIF